MGGAFLGMFIGGGSRGGSEFRLGVPAGVSSTALVLSQKQSCQEGRQGVFVKRARQERPHLDDPPLHGPLDNPFGRKQTDDVNQQHCDTVAM